jgi:PAS domain S-box-containing protein
MEVRPQILIVDDKVENLIALEKVLGNLEVEFVRAASGQEALAATLDNEFAIALVDVQLPDMDGYETVERMRGNRHTRYLPVILLSAVYKEDYHQIKGIQSGAVDFITKPIIPEILQGKVRVFLDLYRHRRRMAEEIQHRRRSEEALQEPKTALQDLNALLKAKIDALTESEEKFRSLVLTIPDIVYRIDTDGRFTFINNAVERLGYRQEELLGEHFSKIVFQPDVEQISRSLVLPRYKGRNTGPENAPKLFDERRSAERRTIGLRVRLMSRQERLQPALLESGADHLVTVEINSSGLYTVGQDSKDKTFIGTVGVIRDVTARNKMEQALRESEERSRAILESTEAGIVLIDPKTKVIVDANPAALRLIGADRDAVIGNICHRFICPSEQGQCPITDLNRQSDNSERMLTSAAGQQIPILKTVVPIQLGGRRHLLESFVDISQRKQMEEALKKARDNLEVKVEQRTAELRRSQAGLIQAEKITALGTMTAGIAHELNNPMMGLLNFIQYCLKHTEPADRRHAVLKDAERETRRCIAIVQNLLTFSRVGGAKERFVTENVVTLVDRVVRLLAYRIEKEKVRLHRRHDDGTSKVPMKTSGIQQVILNLLGNAMDAIKTCAKKKITVESRKNGGMFELAVIDSGRGIPARDLPRIFDPFFTTKPPGKGTGLGLSVSRSIVAEHGGRLTCQSRPGIGTTFTLLLPLEQNPIK